MAAFIKTVAFSGTITSHGHITGRAQRVIRGRARDRATDLTKGFSPTAKRAVARSVRRLEAVTGFCSIYRTLGSASALATVG